MAHRKHSLCTAHVDEDRPRRTRNSTRHTEQLASHEYRYSRYTDPEDVKPRRRRWAAGYIDRPSCSSYAYISTRSRSPDLNHASDTEYITQSRNREDDYIEAREQRNLYTSGHTTNQHEALQSRYHKQISNTKFEDSLQRSDTLEPCYGSDIEDLDDYRHPHKQATTSKSYDSDTGEGSDIVIVNRRDIGSDVASIHSRRSSNSRSDGQSIRSSGMRPDVQDTKKRDVDSSSDSEGGYISLEDYIASRSDCVSNRSSSEDEGEGSDAVGSDVKEDSCVGGGSDVAHGSDVASLSDNGSYDDEEDYIDDGSYYHAERSS